MINATIVADSLSPQGDRLISVLATFPRIILAEINTHRMLSKNTSSSRAIPFNKMVEAVKENPFIPIAWQKEHKGMQGSEYFTKVKDIERNTKKWLIARDNAIKSAMWLNDGFPEDELGIGVTKQLCNRLLEPFMWTTMLITGNKESWNNFFELRCPQYQDINTIKANGERVYYKSKKEYEISANVIEYEDFVDFDWKKINKGQAEIHLMDLAEKIYDAINESTPKQLQAGEWHIPFWKQIPFIPGTEGLEANTLKTIKISTAMAARTSYTVVGDEKEVDYEKMIKLHDKLIEMRHDSPLEHCARAMSDEEYYTNVKGIVPHIITLHNGTILKNGLHKESFGWCRNFKGFIQYRHIIETNNYLKNEN